MRTITSIITVALVLVGTVYLGSLTPLAAGLVAVLASVAAASVINGLISPYALVCGALAAASHAVLWSVAPVVAGALTFVCLYLSRALRAGGDIRPVTAHLAVAALSGGVATWLVASHLTMGWQLVAVSVTMAALVASAPLLFPVDDHVTWVLCRLARRGGGTLGWRLTRAATLRRRTAGRLSSLPRAQAERVDIAFRSLIRLAQVRIDSTGSSADVLDEAIAEHLAAIERGLSAIDQRTAVRTGLESRGAQDLEREVDDIEAEAMAMAEVARER